MCSFTQSFLTLCDLWTATHQVPLYGILQAKLLEWTVISFSGDLPDPGIKPATLYLIQIWACHDVPPPLVFTEVTGQLGKCLQLTSSPQDPAVRAQARSALSTAGRHHLFHTVMEQTLSGDELTWKVLTDDFAAFQGERKGVWIPETAEWKTHPSPLHLCMSHVSHKAVPSRWPHTCQIALQVVLRWLWAPQNTWVSAFSWNSLSLVGMFINFFAVSHCQFAELPR